MPDVGSKKRNQPSTGSGKLGKRVDSTPIIDVSVDTVDQDGTPQEVEPEQAAESTVVEAPPPEQVRDIMRTEPVLNAVFIQSYEGELDENGFYHGEGCAKLKDGLVYTGMFHHGKMNGKGKLQWVNGTVYVGDFIDNVISGKGSYRWSDGSTYEGDVLKGLRHGTGTFSCVDMKWYSGQWESGQRHGTGILHYDESGLSYYSGEWVANEKCGHGTRRFPNGNIYEGEWKNNIRNGKGTMLWLNSGQEYKGEWVDGMQHGKGEYSWYLKRVGKSQYPLRNKYVGEFSHSARHGRGVFHYASGAKYDGEWRQNMKHGHGKFTFKNGSVFVGEFCDDRMVDFPHLILPRMLTPDIESCGIPVTSSMSTRSKSALAMTRNAIVDAFLDIDLDEIFCDYAYDLEEREEEVEIIMRTVLRHTTKLKNIYKVYSTLGLHTSEDNTFVMSKCQFLRFVKDYRLHRLGFTLAQIERYLEEEGITMELCFKKLFIRDFLCCLVRTSYLLFKNDVEEGAHVHSGCFAKLLSVIVNAGNCEVKGAVYKSIKNAEEVNKFIDQIFDVYFYFFHSHCGTLTLLRVLHMFKDLRLITGTLNSTELVGILTGEEKDDEGFYNLEQEITPFEFVEVIVSVSSVFMNDELVSKHRPTHVLPLLSLNTLNIEQSSFDFQQEVEEMRKSKAGNDSAGLQDGGENLSLASSNVDSAAISPIKSSKSGIRAPRKSGVLSKKGEKESSASNVSRGKKDGSRGTGRKSSSTKLDEPKKSHNSKNGDSVDVDTIQGNLQGMTIENSHDSAVERTPKLAEDVLVASEMELDAESSMEIELEPAQDTQVKDEEVAEPEVADDENDVSEEVEDEDFQLWSLRLNLFLKEYFFPKFEHFKMLTELVKARKEQNILVTNEETVEVAEEED